MYAVARLSVLKILQLCMLNKSAKIAGMQKSANWANVVWKRVKQSLKSLLGLPVIFNCGNVILLPTYVILGKCTTEII